MKKIIKSFKEVIRRYKLLSLEAQLSEAGFRREGEGELTYTQITKNSTRVTDDELASMMRQADSKTLDPWHQCFSPVDSPITPRRIFIELEKPEKKNNPNNGEEYYTQRYTVFITRQGI